jgi:hypothetical protein
MTGQIVFITTSQIQNGALERVKEAVRKSVDLIETNGPQLMAEAYIDENELRFHSIQIHRDSESILTHWQLADPYMRDVMQYITTTRVDIFGHPNQAVMEGMQRLSSQGAVLFVTPRFAGFSRLTSSA